MSRDTGDIEKDLLFKALFGQSVSSNLVVGDLIDKVNHLTALLATLTLRVNNLEKNHE